MVIKMSNRVVSLSHGLTVSVPQPYAEGHILTEKEAEKLNHVLADGVRTSLTAKLKRLAEEEGFSAEAHAADFQSYADTYSFVVRTPRAHVDPVEKEAQKIAKAQVLVAIRKKGGSPSDFSAEQISAYVVTVLKNKPEIREEAARRVNSTREIADDLMNELLG